MIKLGVIGAGLYGINHLEAFTQREKYIGDAKVAAFAEVNAERRAEVEARYKVKGYADFTDMIRKEKLDAVTVVTPDHLHYAIVRACLEAGLPVLVEKPLATNVEEAEAMAKLSREKGLLLQVDFHKRFDPYHIDLKMRIERGELGAIQYGYCWMEDMLKVGTDMIGKKTWDNHGSPAWFLGIHMIDLSYWLMGYPKPTKVHATGFKGKLASLGIDIYDSVKAEVTYENKAVITYDTSVILPNSHEAIVRQGVKMVGTEGFMVVDSQYRGARGCSSKKGMETPNLGMMNMTYAKSGEIVKRGYFSDSICDFVDNLKYLAQGHSLKELEGFYASPEQGVESTRIGVAIHESAETGRVVELGPRK